MKHAFRAVLTTALAVTTLVTGGCGAAAAQLLGSPPSPGQCARWSTEAAGAAHGSPPLPNSRMLGCPDVAPRVLAATLRGSVQVRDTVYLDQLAAISGDVIDPAVLDAAVAIASDRQASDPARVLGILVTLAELGGSQYVEGMSRASLFTRALPSTGLCGFEVGTAHRSIDNELPADAQRRAARMLDGILYGRGESVLLHNLARCARTMVDFRIPPQVDTRQVRIDHVCGNTFRVHNHTPVDLLLQYVVLAPDGTAGDEVTFKAPAAGGWTEFTVDGAGTLRVSYDDNVIATAANGGKRCGGASST